MIKIKKILASGAVGSLALLPTMAFAYDFDSQVATTTALATDIASTLFGAFLNLLGTIMPYGIGIFFLFVGINWARKALSGR